MTVKIELSTYNFQQLPKSLGLGEMSPLTTLLARSSVMVSRLLSLGNG